MSLAQDVKPQRLPSKTPSLAHALEDLGIMIGISLNFHKAGHQIKGKLLLPKENLKIKKSMVQKSKS